LEVLGGKRTKLDESMVSKKMPHWLVIMMMMMMMMTMMIMIMIMPAAISEQIYRKCGVNRAPKKTTIRFAFITEAMRNFGTFQRSPPVLWNSPNM